MADRSRSKRGRRRARRRRIAALAVGLLVVAGGGSVALARVSGDSAGPVLATVAKGAVIQTVEASGTIAAASQVSASFAADGTVRGVRVRQGQHVTEGQVLARLDTTSLQSALDSASASVASAKQKLAADRSGQTSTLGTTGSSAAAASGSSQLTTSSYTETALTGRVSKNTAVLTSTKTSTSSAPAADNALNQLVSQITAAQNKVVSGQSTVDAAAADVDAAQKVVDAAVGENLTLRDAQKSACAAGSVNGAPTDACTNAQADYQAFADTLNGDMTSLDTAINTEHRDITTLDSAIKVLDALLTQLPSAAANAGGSPGAGTGGGTGGGGTGGGGTAGGTGGGTGAGGGSGAPGSGTTGSGTPGTGTPGSGAAGGGSGTTGTGAGTLGGSAGGALSSGSGTIAPTGSTPSGTSTTTGSAATSTSPSQTTSQPASASQLAADQASIDSAKAQREVAQQNLAAASLTSPISGTVSTVGFTVGTNSSGQSITILGAGNQTVVIDVPLSEIDLVKVGQPARIAVDGHVEAMHGIVTKIGLLSSTSGSLTTFPVTVTLSDGSPRLHDGAGADVTVTTGKARDVLVVPNSAITTVGTRHIVNVVRDGATSTAQVTLGLAGTDTSEATSGLKAGQQVRLADPGKALPSSATSSSTSTSGRSFAGFPGGGNGGFPNFTPGGR